MLLFVGCTLIAYLQYQDVNACVVDWTNWALYDYFSVAYHFKRKIGAYIAQFLLYFESAGVNLDDVTLVGHSMGAHILGYTGNLLKGRVGSIFGLDPAGPFICWPFTQPTKERLSPSSAKYVQTIVTSKNMMGCPFALGHQNFYANLGLFPQAVCKVEHLEPFHCSHYLGTKIFTFSLIPSLKFKATQIGTNVTDLVGIYSARRRGNFLFQTSNYQPYTV